MATRLTPRALACALVAAVQERYLLAADASRLINMLLNQIIGNDLLPRRAGFAAFEH